ncbi:MULTISPECIES: EF-hand domain-containing protein [unclassified Sinorhizobium]|uniref:EF-hand domain-containing protein n=1 Tax=unclassified Sinorhizobium TaxID=2613772 RepID=UPI003526976C
MKKLTLTAVFVLCQCAIAAAQQQPTQQQPAQQSTSMYEGQMSRLDTNSNGAVDRSEYQAFMNTAFATLDKNKDGNLQKDEASQVLTPAQFAATDSNGNGRISRDEFMTRVMADFAAADRSKDGNLQ